MTAGKWEQAASTWARSRGQGSQRPKLCANPQHGGRFSDPYQHGTRLSRARASRHSGGSRALGDRPGGGHASSHEVRPRYGEAEGGPSEGQSWVRGFNFQSFMTARLLSPREDLLRRLPVFEERPLTCDNRTVTVRPTSDCDTPRSDTPRPHMA